MDKDRFEEIINQNINQKLIKGIGTYQEKTLHKIIKNYYDDNPNNQEVKVDSFICDIVHNDEIIEIQTRSFDKLRNKLDTLLLNHKVKIVYPIPYIKYLSWIDNGEIKSERKSPKKGSIYDIAKELYKIKTYLDNPNLKIIILLINLTEYRNLDGYSKDKKKGSSRYDRVPNELIDEIEINDYRIFIPFDGEFTSADYSKATKENLSRSQTMLTILKYLNLIEVVRKEKRFNVYKKL